MGQPLPTGRPTRFGTAGRLMARFVGSRAFVPIGLGLGLMLVAATGVQLAARWGWALPAPWQTRPHTIQITGPGVDQASTTIQAYILGAVEAPGVYTLDEGARVGDLVQAAGGLLPEADAARVNLAARVADGQEIYVPRVGEVVPPDLTGLVNLNTASAQELHDALGISLDVARRIVAYRETHGSFTAVSQLLLVPISRTTYDRIKDLVTV
jgi:competence protein ComEA